MSTREELTRQAERSLRLGRVDEAIAQHQELAHLEPVDWGLVKQLADLLERAGQREGAARQFARWADHLSIEGFHSKAAALYKKVLKLEPSDEHALWQLGEVSLRLKLRADARVAFQRVAALRERRGDVVGAGAARERLASVDAMPMAGPPPAIPPAYAQVQAAPAVLRVVSPTLPPAQSVLAATPPPASPPPETAAARLARLRRHAQDADARGDRDAERAWQAVLDQDPREVAVRLRLVQMAMERGDLDTATRLADGLDASEDVALVALVDLAHRSGRLADLDRLVADRVHAGASAAHVLAPVDALAARRPAAARAALAAAVGAWAAARQPGHAVAALEQAGDSGLLTIPLYLQWVEISVEAGLPGLSRAQRALADAYRSEHRLSEARAVAEDVFVRDGGTEPSRTLLLDILDRQGVAEPRRVLVHLLTPPGESGGDEASAGALAAVVEVPTREPSLAAPAASVHAEADTFAMADASADLYLAQTQPDHYESIAPSPRWSPVVEAQSMLAASIDVRDAASYDARPATSASEPHDPVMVSPLPAAAVSPTSTGDVTFDWSDLLGRDLEYLRQSPPDVSSAPAFVAAPSALIEPSEEAFPAPAVAIPAARVALAPVPFEPTTEPVEVLRPAIAAEPDSQRHTERAPETTPEAELAIVPAPETVTALAPAPDTATGLAPAPEAAPEPAPAPESEPATAPEPVSSMSPELEPRSGPELAAHPEPEVKAEREPVPGSQVEPAPAAEPEREPARATVRDFEPELPRVPELAAVPESQAEPRQAPDPESLREPAPAAEREPSVFADAVAAPRIGHLRAQPLFADEAPLQPSFSMPRGWLTESSATDDAPRRRAPEDDFFFADDDTPPRWATHSTRAGNKAVGSSPEPGVLARDESLALVSAPVPRAPEPAVDALASPSLPPGAAAADTSAVLRPATPPEEPSYGGEPGLAVDDEVDLTQLLEELKHWDPVLPEPRVRQEAAEAAGAAGQVYEAPLVASVISQAVMPLQAHGPRDEQRTPDVRPQDAATAELDAVFADMQRHTDERMVAEQQLAAGRVFLAAGLVSEAARAFERASLEPRSRFAATLALAELHKSRSQLLDAVSWYEQAAAAPVPDSAVKRAVLYDLAESLEALGEGERALGVLLDLLSQVEDYRDARARLDRLLRVDAGG